MKVVDNQNNTTFAHLNNGVQSMDYQYVTPPPPILSRPAFRLSRPLSVLRSLSLSKGRSEAEAQEANLDKTQLRASAKAALAQDNKGGA